MSTSNYCNIYVQPFSGKRPAAISVPDPVCWNRSATEIIAAMTGWRATRASTVAAANAVRYLTATIQFSTKWTRYSSAPMEPTHMS
jgi:hypothetical protein